MTTWLMLRLCKWLGMLALGAGLWGLSTGPTLQARQQAVYVPLTAGFALTWTAGYGLARLSGVSLGVPWVSYSLLLSLVALQAAVWGVENEERPTAVSASLTTAALVGVLLLMTLQPGGAA